MGALRENFTLSMLLITQLSCHVGIGACQIGSRKAQWRWFLFFFFKAKHLALHTFLRGFYRL